MPVDNVIKRISKGLNSLTKEIKINKRDINSNLYVDYSKYYDIITEIINGNVKKHSSKWK